MMILIVVTAMSFFATIFTVCLVIIQSASLDTELKIAKLVSELSGIEVGYWTMIDENKFHSYPNIKKDIAQVCDMNAFIAENFFKWHREIKSQRVFYKSKLNLYTEIKDCTDDSVKELYNRKNDLIIRVYAIQHPIRHFLYSLILGNRIIIKVNV